MNITKGKIGNALTSTASDHVVAVAKDIYDEVQERYQDGINDYLLKQAEDFNNAVSCFSTGVWENDLHWGNATLWDDNKYAITDELQNSLNTLSETHRNDIKTITERIGKDEEAFNSHVQTNEQAQQQNQQKHEEIDESIRTIEQKQSATEKTDAEQQRQIDNLLYRISLVTNGLWDNALLWVNESEWVNVGEGGTCNCPYNTSDRLDALDEGLAEANAKIEQNTSDIEGNSQSIVDCNTKIDENVAILRKEAYDEHRQIKYDIRAINREQTAQDDNIAKIGEHFSCYADGIWGDLFLWDNDLLWANETGVVATQINEINAEIDGLHESVGKNTQNISNHGTLIQNNSQSISECNQKIDEESASIRQEAYDEHRQIKYDIRAINREQAVQDENISKIGEHFSCYADGEWGDLFSWGNDELWANETGAVQSMQAQISTHESQLASITSTLNLLIAKVDAQQTVIDKQEEQLDEILNLFTVINVGIWCNALLWNNDSEWNNSSIVSQMEGETAAEVSVQNYDADTGTVTL